MVVTTHRHIVACCGLLILLALAAAPRRTLSATTPLPLGIHARGNALIDAAGAPVVLHGVNRSGTEYMCTGGHAVFDGPATEASVAAIAAWHTNAVRIPLQEACWLGINGAEAGYSGQAYRVAIHAYVDLLNAHGLVAILDLSGIAPNRTVNDSGVVEPMPDRAHALDFWRQVAASFNGSRAAVFDLYNEPHDVSWACWRDGGCQAEDRDRTGKVRGRYVVAGMRELIDAVRGTGARNLLLLGGLSYASDFTQWLAYRPDDPMHNLALSWHLYTWSQCNTVACWDTQLAPLARRVPVVAGEIGETDCAHGFIDAAMGWLDAHRAGYLAWAWDTYGCGSFPSLITNFNGTPTAYGLGFKQHLARLAASR